MHTAKLLLPYGGHFFLFVSYTWQKPTGRKQTRGKMPKRSDVWKYFTPLPKDNGKKLHKATCNKCAKEFNTKGGTTSMWRHFLKDFTRIVSDDQGNEKGIVQCNICQSRLKATSDGQPSLEEVEHVMECVKKDAAAAGASRPPPEHMRAPPGSGASSMDLDLAAQPSRPAGSSSDGEEPDVEKAKDHLARMIAFRGYDPSIIDDDCFRSFVQCLNPEFRVPSRVDIEAACDRIFDEARDDIEGRIENFDGRISLAVGKAKIMEREVLYAAWHFIDDEWNLHKVIKEVKLDGPSPYHRGLLWRNFVETVCVESHLLGTNLNTDVLLDCTCDDWFMMAWGITNDYSKLKGYLDHNLLDTYAQRRSLVCTVFMDNILHSVAEHLYLCIDVKFRKDVHDNVTNRILSFLPRQKEKEFLSQVGVDPWACKEAWYSWYCSLAVLECTVTKVGPYWKFEKLLCKIWGGIHRAIERISASNCPTSNLCLLELFNVREILQSKMLQVSNRGHNGFVDNKNATTVLTELREILDKAIQDSYLVWSIPLLLDPRQSLESLESIFKGAFGEDAGSSMSERVTTKVKEVYSDYVNDCDEENQRAKAGEEFDHYLTFGAVVHPTEGLDILNWWKVHGSKQYPTVARMAKDALAMPTCSQLSSAQISHVKSFLRGY
jgi:hypothetical protein